MSTAASGQYWEPRIGQEATQTLKSAYPYIRLFFVVWAFMLIIPIAANAPADHAALV